MSQYLMSLGVLYDYLPIPETNRAKWLDALRDHVVTCLRTVGTAQLADLLGIDPNALHRWVKTRQVGPVADTRGKRRIPNLDRETVMKARGSTPALTIPATSAAPTAQPSAEPARAGPAPPAPPPLNTPTAPLNRGEWFDALHRLITSPPEGVIVDITLRWAE